MITRIVSASRNRSRAYWLAAVVVNTIAAVIGVLVGVWLFRWLGW